MAELADAWDLKSQVERRSGSNPDRVIGLLSQYSEF